ncbi:MAG: GAF domain-containing protein [Gemmatimonadaceae bacterium]
MIEQSKTLHDHQRTSGPPAEDFGAPADAPEEIARLRARLAEVERERDQLIAVIELLQEIAESRHFVDILQAIAKNVGDAFRLDRCSVFLTGDDGEVRLVASYEDPSIRNLVVDINRYPELRRAFETREPVFIPDAANDPLLRAVRSQLESRKVRSIIVVPLLWESSVIGAIFLRSGRDGQPFSDSDVRFCQVIASITARALRNVHRAESLSRQQQDVSAARQRGELQRVALLAFLRRLLDRHSASTVQSDAETMLPRASDEELERLVGIALQVFDEEAKG